MEKNLSYQFKQLGSYLATGSSLEELNIHVDDTATSKYASTVKDHSLDRAFVKVASEFIRNYAEDPQKSLGSILCLEKTASTTDEAWSKHDDEVVDVLTKIAHPLLTPVLAGGITLGTSFLANTPKLLSAGIPVVGSAGGKTLAAGEKAVNEDDLDTEVLKAKIIKYRILTAQLDRELNKRFLKQESDDHFTEIH